MLVIDLNKERGLQSNMGKSKCQQGTYVQATHPTCYVYRQLCQ